MFLLPWAKVLWTRGSGNDTVGKLFPSPASTSLSIFQGLWWVGINFLPRENFTILLVFLAQKLWGLTRLALGRAKESSSIWIGVSGPKKSFNQLQHYPTCSLKWPISILCCNISVQKPHSWWLCRQGEGWMGHRFVWWYYRWRRQNIIPIYYQNFIMLYRKYFQSIINFHYSQNPLHFWQEV